MRLSNHVLWISIHWIIAEDCVLINILSKFYLVFYERYNNIIRFVLDIIVSYVNISMSLSELLI